MERAVIEVPRQHALAGAVLAHDQIEGEIFDEEFRLMAQALLIERMQDRVAGAVGGGAGAERNALAVIGCHAAEGALIDAAILGAREGHAVMLELDDRLRRHLAHIFDGVLVAEPVGALDRVVHVPAPIVIAHIAECGGHAALRGDGVTARREQL